MQHKLLAELEEGLRNLKKNFAQREIVSNFAEVARTLGLSRMTIYRYRQLYADIPSLPTYKTVLRIWAAQKRIPRKRGPRPLRTTKEVGQTQSDTGSSVGECQKAVT